MVWKKLTIDTSVCAVDLLSAFLDEQGVSGIEICDNVPLTEEEKKEMYVDIPLLMGEDDGSAKVSCYIDDTFDIETLKADIACELTRLEEFLSVGAKTITVSETEDADWMNNWKQFFSPFRLYDDIIIKPTWEELSDFEEKERAGGVTGKPPVSECVVVEIDPGIAFGTGSHETTKLCIGQLKKYLREGDSVFDVGCGSGILSIVAKKIGAGYVHGMDIDELAVSASRENAALNHISEEELRFSCGNLLEDNYIGRGTTFELSPDSLRSEVRITADRQYDVVVANILADVIVPLSGVIAPFLKPDGYFITSGILDTKEAEVRAALFRNGFLVVDVARMNDWVCLVAKPA